jgi:thiol-disulfide isomerase/thioredoxin
MNISDGGLAEICKNENSQNSMKRIFYLMVISLVVKEVSAQSTFATLESGNDKTLSAKQAATLTDSGIQWVKRLSWEEIKAKAKQENKFIFLDCFTTWCGPCKRMDVQVYNDETVGSYFNQHFLSVKVQMDKTDKDDDEIKRWYDDAKLISKQFYIAEYPTFVFLNPQGVVVDQQIGFKTVKEFVTIAQNATKPGRLYKNPNEAFEELLIAYKNGERNYEKYPFMMTIALKLRDTIFIQLERELIKYMTTLLPEERYTKERIEVLSIYTYASTTRVFRFFYNDGKLIDKVMNEKGYSRKVIDKTIQTEIVMPFFNEQNKNPKITMSGMYLGGGPPRPADSSEADWKKLEKAIRNKFNAVSAKRNVLEAKLEWYARHTNLEKYVKYGLVKLKKYPPNVKIINDCSMTNYMSWTGFIASCNKKYIKGYIKYMERVIKGFPYPPAAYIDTYANLLYKYGYKNKAIIWEQKALELTHGQKYGDVVEQMKLGKPTYTKQGAVWANDKNILNSK